MRDQVKVSAIQMNIEGLNPEANVKHMGQMIEKTIAGNPVELIVFPELANSGYVKPGDPEFRKQYFQCAEKIPGPFCEALGNGPRNSASIS